MLPKSIDEAPVDLTNYQLVYKDMSAVAQRIKQAIRANVGDYLRCSIGIAPNVFLAKLASTLQKPDESVVINPANIDMVLARLTLTDLPGIGEGMAARLRAGGITSPLDLRYASPDRLKLVCQSIIGWHWHLRLNFGGEVDLATHPYQQMQTIRTVSVEQRRSPDQLEAILQSLCLTLERRMVHRHFFCCRLQGWVRYQRSQRYEDTLTFDVPVQDGIDLFMLLRQRMQAYEQLNGCGSLLNDTVQQLGVSVSEFVPADQMQYDLFDDHSRRDKFRQTLHDVKARFGAKSLVRATELRPEAPIRDLIGFGSIKDLYDEPTYW